MKVFILKCAAFDMVEVCATSPLYMDDEVIMGIILPYAKKYSLDPDVGASLEKRHEMWWAGPENRDASRTYLELNLRFTHDEQVLDAIVKVDVLEREIKP